MEKRVMHITARSGHVTTFFAFTFSPFVTRRRQAGSTDAFGYDDVISLCYG